MVQHFLLWRFSDEIREGDTAPYLEQIADSVATLADIPQVISAGIQPLLPGGEWDFLFCVTLKDLSQLSTYQNHPLHQAHQKRCQDWLVKRTAFDLQVPDGE